MRYYVGPLCHSRIRYGSEVDCDWYYYVQESASNNVRGYMLMVGKSRLMIRVWVVEWLVLVICLVQEGGRPDKMAGAAAR
jgi:hypothetical protein